MSEISLRKDSIVSKILMALLIVLNVLFLVYWVGLSLNYRLHYDDVHFMWKVQEYNIWEYVKEMYMTRGGNFAGYGKNYVLFSFANVIENYTILPILSYVIGILMVWGAFRGKIKHIGQFTWLMLLLAFYNIYVLTNLDYAVFTWLCAMSYYLMGPKLCLLLRYLNEKELVWWRWMILIVLIVTIGGGNVINTAMVLMVMFFNGLYYWKQNDWKIDRTWNTVQVKKIIYVALAILILYVIVIVAPGNYARLSAGAGTDKVTSLLGFAKGYLSVLITYNYFMLFYIPYYFVAAMVAYYFGTKFDMPTKIDKKRVCMYIIGAYVLYLIVSAIPNAYLCGGIGMQRNYTPIVFFMLMSCCGVGYVLGAGKKQNAIWSGIVSVVGTFIMCIVMVVNIRIDFPIVKQYAKAVDERFEYLSQLQNKGNEDTIVVVPYPSSTTIDAKYVISGWLGKKTNKQAIYYESDTDVQPNEYEGHVKKLLKLDFDFVLADKKKE